jgi:N6-adenosine-specific RNA methylase IME4
MELFANIDRSVLLVDIPRSIELAQTAVGPAQIRRRIISSPPLEAPWQVPSGQPGTDSRGSVPPSILIDELMVSQRLSDALNEVKNLYAGSWCLPRVCQSLDDHTKLGNARKRKAPGPATQNEVVESEQAFLPKDSQYLQGIIASSRDKFIATAPIFDLIVMDPPWPSRSVKRKKDSYTTAYDLAGIQELLSQIPVASHLSSDGLVAVWVTNKPKAIDFLHSPKGMFALWGLEPVADWTWLKVTSQGEPVLDLGSQWRKPWERLLIAKKKGSARVLPPELKSRVIIAVPDHHSRKPNLKTLFEDIFPPGYAGLEVFARNLTAGWWSWGDQVLLFQEAHHWVELAGGASEVEIGET